MAFLSSLITNIAIKQAAGKKQVELTEVIDFMPEWYKSAPEQTPVQSIEDMKKVMMEIAKASNRKVQRNDTFTPPTKLKKKKDG